MNKTILLIFGEYATRIYSDILLEKNHFTGFIQSRLDYIFISNNIQYCISKMEKVRILASFCSHHSPISCILESFSKIQLGKNFWRFSSSLINVEKYVTQMKQHISEFKSQFNPAFGTNLVRDLINSNKF